MKTGFDLSLISGGQPVNFVADDNSVWPVDFVGMTDKNEYGVVFYRPKDDVMLRSNSNGECFGGGKIQMVPRESKVYLVARNGTLFSTAYSTIEAAKAQWAFIDRKEEFELFEVSVNMDVGKPLFE